MRSATIRLVVLGLCASLLAVPVVAARPPQIAADSRVFVQAVDGFGTDLVAALIGANVPLRIVTDRTQADLEIAGRRQRRETQNSFRSGEWTEEVTLTVTDIRAALVIDAFTVSADTSEKVARLCAKRLSDRITSVTAAPAASSVKPAASLEATAAPSTLSDANSMRLFVQGDFNRLADFTEVLRMELRSLGVGVHVVERGEDYDYSVIFVQADTDASAVALDRQGILVASVIDSGFRAKGVSEGAARKLAKRLLSVKKQ